MATLAVFGVLGGTAWAIGANSVGSRQIKPSAVKTTDLANDAVTSAKVLGDSLTGADVAEGTLGQVPSAQFAQAAQTAQFAQAAQTAQFAQAAQTATTAADSDTLDGLGSGAFAATGHDHDSTYVNEGQAGAVTGAMISDPLRAVSIPLGSFVDCENSSATFLDFTSDNDALPNFEGGGANGGGFNITWDVSAVPDVDTAVCSEVTVPPDFVSDPTIRIRVAQVLPGDPAETIALATRRNFGGLSSFSATPLPPSGNVSVSKTVTTPIAVDDSLRIALQAGVVSGGMNDTVRVLAVEFVYTAEQ